jgi:hypothetical protein
MGQAGSSETFADLRIYQTAQRQILADNNLRGHGRKALKFHY